MNDVISRSELIETISKYQQSFIGSPNEVAEHDRQCNFAKWLIEEASIVDATKVVHGQWIEEPLRKYPNEHIDVCSECKRKSLAKYNYCPNCGAQMDL